MAPDQEGSAMRPQVKMLYAYLQRNPARVVEKDELIGLFWGHDRDGGPEWAIECVNILIHNLRRVLSTASDERLRTIYGVGYAYETGTHTLGTLSEWICGDEFFSRQERVIMRLLLRHGTVTYERVRLAIWGDDDRARTHHLGTLILFLRRKLRTIGYGIEVIRGEAIRLVRIEQRREQSEHEPRGGLAAECAA
jgi:DNA-binding response OmpR family regulator